jgi:hypothetical protein
MAVICNARKIIKLRDFFADFEIKSGAHCAAFYFVKLCYRFIALQKQKTREAFKSFREFLFCCSKFWWSRRESNPRPEAIHKQFYMRSSVV